MLKTGAAGPAAGWEEQDVGLQAWRGLLAARTTTNCCTGMRPSGAAASYRRKKGALAYSLNLN